MYARSLASVCLLSVGAFAAPAAAVLPAEGGKLVVLLRHAPDIAPETVASLERETARLIQSAGVRLNWIRPSDPVDVQNGTLILVDLRGSCELSQLGSATMRLDKSSLHAMHLGSTSVSDGRVLPFVTLDCHATRGFLATSLRGEPSEDRERLFGRALGRILAHELYHVSAQTGEHSTTGVAKATMTCAELLGTQFEFDHDAVLRLRSY